MVPSRKEERGQEDVQLPPPAAEVPCRGGGGALLAPPRQVWWRWRDEGKRAMVAICESREGICLYIAPLVTSLTGGP
ncbi:hypothetical protein E2562_006917 [Oryza meyeriana var. granulata]|uniref:Uncharacterized protein n=1 Tax=Oryza meyeriana var. granulata TaxID=110450 RepID=A0A6G1BJN7_9ORYZ|nr:hypothetical protein E2562_006917 [Oryza meyeriana var. granulata]